MPDVVNIEYMLPFIGIVLLTFSSFYLCCKKMDILRIENRENENIENERRIENEIIQITNNERIENETQNLLPEYKLRDDPPAYG